MNKILSRQIIIAIFCIVSGILFGLTAYFVQEQSIQSFDLPIIHFVQGLETPWLTTLLKTFTWIGSAYFVVPATLIACYLLYFVYKRRSVAYFFASVMVINIVMNGLLKQVFGRVRPDIYRMIPIEGLSFPSGHTMMAVSLYMLITYVVWRALKTSWQRLLLILLSFSMILMITVSRIYLGVHFPSDIMGGIWASLFLVTAMILLFERFWGHKSVA